MNPPNQPEAKPWFTLGNQREMMLKPTGTRPACDTPMNRRMTSITTKLPAAIPAEASDHRMPNSGSALLAEPLRQRG